MVENFIGEVVVDLVAIQRCCDLVVVPALVRFGESRNRWYSVFRVVELIDALLSALLGAAFGATYSGFLYFKTACSNV